MAAYADGYLLYFPSKRGGSKIWRYTDGKWDEGEGVSWPSDRLERPGVLQYFVIEYRDDQV